MGIPPVSPGSSTPPSSPAVTPVPKVLDSISSSSATSTSSDLAPVGIIEGQITMGGLMDVINGVMHAAQRNTRDMVNQEILRAKSFFDIAARNARQISESYETGPKQFKADTIISVSQGKEADDLNTAIANLNSAANNHNSNHSSTSKNRYNDAVDDYNAAVAKYNAKIADANALIDSSGEDLPHQSFQPFSTLSEIASASSNASRVNRTATDPRDLELSDYVSDNLSSNNTDTLDLFSTFSKLINQSLNDAVDDSSKAIRGPTRATTFIPISSTTNLRPEDLENADISTQTLGILSSSLDAWLSKGLYAKAFEDLATPSADKVLEQLRLLALQTVLQTALGSTLPGAALLLPVLSENPNRINETVVGQAGRIGISTALTARLIGLLSSQQLLPAIKTLLGNSPDLSGLTADEKSELAKNLTALVTSSLLLTAVGSLATELQNPGIFGALSVGNTIADPAQREARFAGVQQNLGVASQQYGQAPVIALLAQFLAPTFADAGLSRSASQAASSQVANGLVAAAPGFDTATNVRQSVVAQAVAAGKSSDQGTALADEILKSTFLFAASTNLRSTIQESLIGAIGPQLAPTLTDEITRLLTGVSVDFNNAQITTLKEENDKAKSVASLISDQQGILKASDGRKVSEGVDRVRTQQDSLSKLNSDRFDDFQKVNTDLGVFLTAILDPGERIFGLMYAGVQQVAKAKGRVGMPDTEPSAGITGV